MLPFSNNRIVNSTSRSGCELELEQTQLELLHLQKRLATQATDSAEFIKIKQTIQSVRDKLNKVKRENTKSKVLDQIVLSNNANSKSSQDGENLKHLVKKLAKQNAELALQNAELQQKFHFIQAAHVQKEEKGEEKFKTQTITQDTFVEGPTNVTAYRSNNNNNNNKDQLIYIFGHELKNPSKIKGKCSATIAKPISFATLLNESTTRSNKVVDLFLQNSSLLDSKRKVSTISSAKSFEEKCLLLSQDLCKNHLIISHEQSSLNMFQLSLKWILPDFESGALTETKIWDQINLLGQTILVHKKKAKYLAEGSFEDCIIRLKVIQKLLQQSGITSLIEQVLKFFSDRFQLLQKDWKRLLYILEHLHKYRDIIISIMHDITPKIIQFLAMGQDLSTVLIFLSLPRVVVYADEAQASLYRELFESLEFYFKICHQGAIDDDTINCMSLASIPLPLF